MTFYVKIAGLKFKITTVYEYTMKLCRDYIVDDNAQTVADIVIGDNEIAREKEYDRATNERQGIEWRLFPDYYYESLAVYRKLSSVAIDYKALLFHGSSFAFDGRGIILTAKSGTGKSTHARIWRENFPGQIIMVNDDKPWLKLENDGRIWIYGTPWCGKHHLGTNIGVPAEAICFLSRAENNSCEEVNPDRRLKELMEQSMKFSEPAKMVSVLEVVSKITGTVKFYDLRCNMEPEAAITAKRAIIG